ncbi:MAG: PP2C family protein-serine/threonine phosphatase [Parahaliea sp.]
MMASKGNVLVIDDDPGRARAMAALVDMAGFHVDVANELSEETYARLRSPDLDATVCEMSINGVLLPETQRTLRDMDIKVPAIMLSSEVDADRMMTALRMGASDFFLRPVEDTGALIESIQRCVRRRQMRRELDESRKRLEATNMELRGAIRVLEQDQQAGRQVQLSMLPATPLILGDYNFSHSVIPSLFLSGDFTDYFTIGTHHVVFFMADVSGHGSSSAFATVLLKNLFARKRSDYTRKHDDTVMSPVAMLQRGNQELLRLDVGKYATMVVGLLNMERNILRYSVAGHLPQPVLVSQQGVRYLTGSGSPVGLLEDAEYEEHEVELPDNFTIALFSDGILEILPSGDLIEKEAYLLEAFERAAETPEAMIARLGLSQLDVAPDDIAALFISKRS